MRGHLANVGNRLLAELAADHVQVRPVREVHVERVVAEAEHLARRQMPGRQRQGVDRVLRVAAPCVGQLPPLPKSLFVERRSRVRHRRIKVRKLTVQIQRQIQRARHRLCRVFRQAENEVANDVDAGVLDLTHRLVNLVDVVALVDVDEHLVVGGLDAQREPVEAGALQLVEHVVFHRVDARVSPDVQVVAAVDNQIADAKHVAHVQHEHFVGEFDVSHAVLVHEQIDFVDHPLWAPEPVAVHVGVEPERMFTALERRLNTAERAVIRAAAAGVEDDQRP